MSRSAALERSLESMDTRRSKWARHGADVFGPRNYPHVARRSEAEEAAKVLAMYGKYKATGPHTKERSNKKQPNNNSGGASAASDSATFITEDDKAEDDARLDLLDRIDHIGAAVTQKASGGEAGEEGCGGGVPRAIARVARLRMRLDLPAQLRGVRPPREVQRQQRVERGWRLRAGWRIAVEAQHPG